MSEPERTWPEDRRPSVPEYWTWLTQGSIAPEEWQLANLHRLLDAAERGDECFLRDHQRQGLALWAVTQDLHEMEGWVRNLLRDLEGWPEGAFVCSRLRQILGDEEERGSRQRPTQPSDFYGTTARLEEERLREQVKAAQPLECGAQNPLFSEVRCEKLDGHSGWHATHGTEGHQLIWPEQPTPQMPDASPHPIAHMTHGRCSLGSISHPPHPGCEGVPEGEPAPTTMIGRRDDLHRCHADGEGPCAAECCPISRGEPTLCAGTHAPNAQGCDASGGGADASWLG